MQAHIAQFRVIERFCIESNKRSDRGALHQGFTNYLLTALSEGQYRHFVLELLHFLY